ncbi:MAG: hypothetical protein BWY76_01545 [bacterium ADurb.Bin429]|nr:MAG: hypothetical protein BWY76_01545 [bacterium ADurb.Bin429]
MRVSLFLFVIVCVAGSLAQTPPPAQPQRPIYTALVTDVEPQIVAGRTFVPVAVIAREFGATVTWVPEMQRVHIARASERTIILTIGTRTALVDGQPATLDAAPFITRGRTMVPLRFIAETYRIPVTYDGVTRTVRLTRANRHYVLPLPSFKAGVVIADPRPGELVRTGLRVQGVANVYEGALIIEVRDSGGRVLGRTIATAGMGGFYPFSTVIYYNLPSDDPSNGRIVVYSQNGRGDGKILAEDSVPVVLASTI